jgi:hypothetical protein
MSDTEGADHRNTYTEIVGIGYQTMPNRLKMRSQKVNRQKKIGPPNTKSILKQDKMSRTVIDAATEGAGNADKTVLSVKFPPRKVVFVIIAI